MQINIGLDDAPPPRRRCPSFVEEDQSMESVEEETLGSGTRDTGPGKPATPGESSEIRGELTSERGGFHGITFGCGHLFCRV